VSAAVDTSMLNATKSNARMSPIRMAARISAIVSAVAGTEASAPPTTTVLTAIRAGVSQTGKAKGTFTSNVRW
jgi:hypothetical protein